MMMIAYWILGSLVGLVIALLAIGACLPPGHVATSGIRIGSSPQQVWDVASDYATWATWAPGVKSMERLPDRVVEADEMYQNAGEKGRRHPDPADPPRRRVTRILDEGLPFGGSWTWEFAADGAGTRVTLTEDGVIRNLLFRALSRFVFGHHATLEKFLAALAKRMGSEGAMVARVR